MPKIACVAVLFVSAVAAQTNSSYEKVHSPLWAQAKANAHGYGQVGFSPEILSIRHKPFTATRTYSYQRTENGKNVGEPITAEGTIARDDKGRIHHETAFTTHEKGRLVIGGFLVAIYDPVGHTLIHYKVRADHSLPPEPKALVQKLKLMSELMNSSPAAAPKNESEGIMDAPPAAAESNPTNKAPASHIAIVPTKDDLPVQWVDGRPAVIHRSVSKYGDKQQFVQIQDNWFSPEFAMDVEMIVLRETHGKETVGTRDIVAGEPDPALFEIPAGYVVKFVR